MLKILSVIYIITICFLAGCLESESTRSIAEKQTVSKSSRLVEYLEKQNLPALKSVQQWENNYGQGLKLTTAHYEIYTTLLDPLMLHQIPGFLESAYKSYQNQLPRPIETRALFTTYLFGTRQHWEAFTKTFTGPQAPLYLKIKAGAYYLNGACVVYNVGRERTFSVLGHEGWHQFNSRHFQFRLPSWLDEGIAMLFEVSREDQGLFYFEPARNLQRLGSLRKTLIKDKMIPLRKLITMNPGEAIIASSDKVAAFYSQCYALVRFLREEDYGKRLGNYHQLLLSGLRGTWPLSDAGKRIAADRNIPLTVQWNRTVSPLLFQHYIGSDFDQLEEEYKTFCRKIVYHIRLK